MKSLVFALLDFVRSWTMFFHFFALLLFSTQIHAAEFEDLGGCEFRLTGTIKTGDAEVFDLSGCSYSKLYLDSPGGAVLEALKIAEGFYRTTTILDEDAECLSACALIFMAGRQCSGAPFSCSPTRAMHATATLGFHAPFLEEANSDELVPLNLTFSAAIETLSLIQDTFSEFSYTVRQTGYDREIIPFDLMAKILSTPPTDFYYITDNDQFFAFDIGIIDDHSLASPEDLSEDQIFFLCYNLIYNDLRGWNYSSFGFSGYTVSNYQSDRESTNVYDFVYESSSTRTYFMQLSGINMGPAVSGMCKVAQPTSDQWGTDYLRVSFFGDYDIATGLTVDDVANETPLARQSRIRLSDSMHSSMGYPLQTSIEQIRGSGRISSGAEKFIRDYFESLNKPQTTTRDQNTLDFWISEKRELVSEAISSVCGAQIISGIRPSASDSPGGVGVLLEVEVRHCSDGGLSTYRVEVQLMTEMGELKIRSIGSP